MHAFLLISQSSNLKPQIDKLAGELHAAILEFPLAKIEDVRNLNNLIRLSLSEPTLIVSENIHQATPEALNAFLKNLEEPQENLYFALTAPSVKKVLSTIVSRCQVIKITNAKFQMTNGDTERFLEFSVGEKLNFIDKIKDRAEAIHLIEDIIMYLHELLHSNEVNYQKTAKNIEVATNTLINLKANGNISLQLTSLVISLR